MYKLKQISAAAVLVLAYQSNVFASPTQNNIPYANVGHINPLSYTFTALNDGTVNAYFGGSTAGYTEVLGLAINGVDTGKWGLQNKSNGTYLPIGTEMSWNVHAGDKLTFFDYIWGWNSPQYNKDGTPTGGSAYVLTSDPSLNSDKNQHVYATPLDSATFNKVVNSGYVEDLSMLPSKIKIPAGGTPPVFVAFEDLTSPHGKTSGSDYNYNDLNYVYTNVAVKSFPTAPEMNANLAALSLGLLASIVLVMTERRRSI